MINAEEHKKLLEQITELERNSVNYFDVEKEFFLIDSNNLADVQTRFYGYSIQRDGIYEQDNLTPEAIAGLDGRGCYVYVEVKDGKITIKQDLNGCWGIYLFRHGDYFALSNSFFRLVDHIKIRYPLTVNRDYCHYFLVNNVSSHTYSETAVNEIQLVKRNAIFHIDINNKTLETEFIDYKEHSISPDSKKGVVILDRWLELWSTVLRGVTQHTKFVKADLSGGFDTRIALIPLLLSGIDFNRIKVNSINRKYHTFTEDYAIASKIADHYDFELNPSFTAPKSFKLSLADSFTMDLYTQQTFHNIPVVSRRSKNVDKLYYLAGYGGETVRSYWLRFGSWADFIKQQMNITKKYSLPLSAELTCSMKNLLDVASHTICDKYKIEDVTSGYIQQYLYQETRSRHHHGKDMLGYYFGNVISLSPAFDPDIRTLKLETQECPDPNLLIALLFTRYAPDLLKFPFEGKRSIAPETIEYAKKNKQTISAPQDNRRY